MKNGQTKMKIKIEIETDPEPFPRETGQDDDGPRTAVGLDPLVIIGQGSLSTLYCPDPKRPGRLIASRPDGTLIDRTV